MYPVLILLLYLFAVFLIFISIDRNFHVVSRQLKKASRLNVKLREKYQNDHINAIMKNAGLPFSLYHYQIFRLAAFVVFLTIIGWQALVHNQEVLFKVFFLVVLFFISLPQDKIFGFNSPFTMLINASQQRKRDRYNEELYLTISQLKNGFLVAKDKPPSSQHVLEEVTRYANLTKSVFNRFLSFWMLGERDKAVEYFDREIGTKEAKKLSQVFLKLDDLNPVEMREQLDAYQEIYRAERETRKKKKNEVKSNILFIAVLATSLMILLNFVIVGFFIDFLKSFNDLL